MPGICGFFNNKDINKMVQSMDLSPYLKTKESFEKNNVALSQISVNHFQNEPLITNEYALYVEGECYNLEEVCTELSLECDSFEQVLLSAYKNNLLEIFLKRIDAFFSAVIYDIEKEKIMIFTDRWGLKLLYWYKDEQTFAFASEVKAILALQDIDKKINKDSFECFMDLGHLLGENTWFEKIKLIKPASIIEFDIKENSIKQDYYWKFNEIKPQEISFDDAATKLGELLLSSVKKRFNPEEKSTIPLSGGLDSRMIFAAVKKLYPQSKPHVFTFGQTNCDDILIAKQVCKVANHKQEIFLLDSLSMIESRVDKVWITDGMQHLMHMHASAFNDEFAKYEVLFNGYLGDLVCGGSYLNKNNGFLNKRIDEDIAKSFFGKHYFLTDINDSFFDINHIDPFFYMNRGRRFTNTGVVNVQPYINDRKPFMDNELIEFVLSIPDEYRLNNKLYAKALLKTFPEYFENIIWQNTGKLINEQDAKKTFKQIISGLFSRDKKKYSYHDYKNWIKKAKNAAFLYKNLNRKNAQYCAFTDEDFIKSTLKPHLDNKANYTDKLLKILTIELYLKKVFKSDKIK